MKNEEWMFLVENLPGARVVRTYSTWIAGACAVYAGLHMLVGHGLLLVAVLLISGGLCTLLPDWSCRPPLNVPLSWLLWATGVISCLSGLYIWFPVHEWYVGIPIILSGILNIHRARRCSTKN
jgi:hypothetical protein